jgi:hypothetical protein
MFGNKRSGHVWQQMKWACLATNEMGMFGNKRSGHVWQQIA